jgi:hypothetical protein
VPPARRGARPHSVLSYGKGIFLAFKLTHLLQLLFEEERLIYVVVRLYFQKIILLFIKEIISRIEVHVERKIIVLLLKEDNRWMF